MIYYGFVSKDIATVFESWSSVEQAKLWTPYSRYKKFYSRETAWEWVKRQPIPGYPMQSQLRYYGNVSEDSPHLYVRYKILPGSIAFSVSEINMKGERITIATDSESVRVTRKQDKTIVTIEGLALKVSYLKHHLLALGAILHLIGGLGDIVLELESGSLLYYLIDKESKFNRRGGRIGYCVNNFVLLDKEEDNYVTTRCISEQKTNEERGANNSRKD